MPFCLLARNPSPGSCSPISLQLLARHSSSPGFHRTNQSTFQIFCCLYESTADSWSFPANLHDKRLLSRDKQSTISSTSIQLFAFLLLFNLLLQITWHCNKNPCNFVANKKKQRTIQNNLPQSCSQLGNMKSIKIRHSIVILMKRRVFLHRRWMCEISLNIIDREPRWLSVFEQRYPGCESYRNHQMEVWQCK